MDFILKTKVGPNKIAINEKKLKRLGEYLNKSI